MTVFVSIYTRTHRETFLQITHTQCGFSGWLGWLGWLADVARSRRLPIDTFHVQICVNNNYCNFLSLWQPGRQRDKAQTYDDISTNARPHITLTNPEPWTWVTVPSGMWLVCAMPCEPCGSCGTQRQFCVPMCQRFRLRCMICKKNEDNSWFLHSPLDAMWCLPA